MRSADWAKAVAGARVAELVMATRHEAIPGDVDAQVLLDVDLSAQAAANTGKLCERYEAQARRNLTKR